MIIKPSLSYLISIFIFLSRHIHIAAAGGEGNDDFSVPNDNFGSIFLVLFCCLSILCSLYVVCSIIKLGAKSSAAKLVLFINIASAICTSSRFPFYLKDIDKMCAPLESIFWYSFFQIQLVCIYMLWCTNKILYTSGSFKSTEPYKLSRIHITLIFLIPLLPVILTATVPPTKYDSAHMWCGINRHVSSGKWRYACFIVFLGVIELICLTQIIRMVQYARTTTPEIYSIVKDRVIRGPASYAIATFGVVVGVAVCGLYMVTYDHQPDVDDYYNEYSMLIVYYTLNIFYVIIYVNEKEHLSVSSLFILDVLLTVLLLTTSMCFVLLEHGALCRRFSSI